jgi:hypothetical protein
MAVRQMPFIKRREAVEWKRAAPCARIEARRIAFVSVDDCIQPRNPWNAGDS